MIPLDAFGSESVAADLLQQVRWRDGISCPRCRSDRTVRNGSYGQFQRYFCKDCDRTFNGKTGTIFAHSKIALRKWLFSIYAFCGLTRVSGSYSAKSRSPTKRSAGVSSASLVVVSEIERIDWTGT
ncbi:transposase [Halorubrum sp. BOL3-1]|uniref:transposase-like zinc-binding domain-containing protein n=1 Tax=Halorubrum sp. BOL3-1 TaxID=2497325 RepID=UPI00374381AA